MSLSVSSNPVRLAALFSHPIQYFAPLFRTLSSRPGVDLTVYYCSRTGLERARDHGFGCDVQWDIPLLEGYRSHFLTNRSRRPDSEGFGKLVNPGIVRELQRERYDALLVHGYNYATHWLAFMAARRAGTPVLLRGESNLLARRRLHTRLVKKATLRPMLRSAAACLPIGQSNRDYYRNYGVCDNRLVDSPYSVDNDFFRARIAGLRRQGRTLREELNIPAAVPVILYAGKLIPQKQPLHLLAAYEQVRAHQPCALVYAGDGAMRPEIERRCLERSIRDVHVTGFLNQSRMPAAYAAADLFVLPSGFEPWGLVVNEAMNGDLPVIVTDQVGCARDLVQEGENGYIVPSTGVAALAGRLDALVASPDRRRSFGARSRRIIDSHSLDHTADGILAACARVSR